MTPMERIEGELSDAQKRIAELEYLLARQAKAAQRGMDAAKKAAGSNLEQAKRLHDECNPQALESERAANAQMTEQIAKLEAHIAALRDDLEIHRAAEEALVAHVEQLSYVIVDAKRCAAVLAFPSNYNASDYQSFADAVMGNIETLSKQEPTNALTRRDLIKQAEALELVNCQSGPQEDTPQEDAFDAGWAAAFELIRQFASELRQQAEALNESPA